MGCFGFFNRWHDYVSNNKPFLIGRVAQLVEQVTFNHWVTGSNPVPLTIFRGHCDWQVICSLAWFHALFLASVAGQVTLSPVAKRYIDYNALELPICP